MTNDQIIDDFAAATTALPLDAMIRARKDWGTVAPALLGLLENYASGSDRSDRANDALFFALFLFAEMQETRAFAPLCRLACDGNALHNVLGDGVTESLARIIPRIWGGDLDALRSVIDCDDSEEYVRGAFLDAFAGLALSGAIDHGLARDYLLALPDRLTSESESYVWFAWSDAAMFIVGDAAEPLIRRAYESGRIEPGFGDVKDFESDLRELKRNRAKALARRADSFPPIDDAIAELSLWEAFSGREARRALSERGLEQYESGPETPAVNPFRDVGRNDPCPCGSGKKFKKCCLPAADAT